MRKLVAERIELFVMDRYVFGYLIEKHPEYQAYIEPLEPALHLNYVHMMFSKESDEVERKLMAFNQGLESIKRDRTLQQIIDRHLRALIAPGE